eukprot:6938114-Alexandrium_andersonii.AAC.1
MLGCAVHLSRFCAVLSSAGHVLTSEEHDRAMAASWGALDLYTRLSYDCAQHELKCFNVVNKHHMTINLAMQSAALNPECVWTYPFEDLVGRMQKVAMGSKAGLMAL